MMITDHTETSSELKHMVPSDMQGAVPTSLDDSSQKKLNKLRDAKPEDFASEYDPMQVSAHKTPSHCSSATPKTARMQS
jgi:putative membrane protein